jgi:sorting nexin-29
VLERKIDCRRVGTSKSKIPIQKSKRNDCSNYRGISLLNSGYKIYAKIITQRFKTISEAILREERNGFRIGRSCIDNVFTIKQTREKTREFNLETHIAFLDLEKAFDRVN